MCNFFKWTIFENPSFQTNTYLDPTFRRKQFQGDSLKKRALVSSIGLKSVPRNRIFTQRSIANWKHFYEFSSCFKSILPATPAYVSDTNWPFGLQSNNRPFYDEQRQTVVLNKIRFCTVIQCLFYSVIRYFITLYYSSERFSAIHSFYVIYAEWNVTESIL